MANTITIELCAEDRARLDKLIKALEKGHDAATEQPAAPAAQPAPGKAAEEPAAPAEQADGGDWLAPEEPEAQTAPEVKLADIQRLIVTLATGGKKAEARTIVKSYAERVPDIPADKYAEVYAKLKKLEG